jgi:hypothetical protein
MTPAFSFNSIKNARSGWKNMLEETPDKNLPRFFQRPTTVVKVITYLIIGAATVVSSLDYLGGTWNRYFGSDSFYDLPLESQALDLKQDLLTFLKNRKDTEPNFIAARSETPEHLVAHTKETMAIYVEDFRPKVIYVRHRFLERGLANTRLDLHYEHPVNPFGIEEIAAALDDLVVRVRKQNHENKF